MEQFNCPNCGAPANGVVAIRFENCRYITHFSNVCLIETPND